MTPALRHHSRAIVILFTMCMVHADAELLEYEAALASTASPTGAGTATFLGVAATTPGPGPAPPPLRAFPGGFFTDEFRLGPQNVLVNPQGEDGMLAGLRRDPANGTWVPDWLLHVPSNGGDARITDVAIGPNGEVFVTGIFTSDITIDLAPPAGPVTFVAPPRTPEGFVAWADPQGAWISAFQVPGMEPSSLALDDNGAIYLTGLPVLVRRYDQLGAEQWSVPAPPEAIALQQIAVAPDALGGGLFVAGSLDGDPGNGVNEDAFVTHRSRQDGSERWTAAVASRGGSERPGGLGIGPLGGVRFSFSSDDSVNVAVDGQGLQDLPVFPARHAHLLFLGPDGTLANDTLLGTSLTAGSTMDTRDLAVDRAGNAHVAVSLSGPYQFEGVIHPGDNDAAIVTVDATGVGFRFSGSSGTAQSLGNAVAAPDRRLQVLVGEFLGQGNESFGPIPLPPAGEPRAYLAALTPRPDQQAYILVSDLNEQLDVMEQRVTQAGGEVYRTIEFRNEGVRMVAAFLTPELIQVLDAAFTLTEDVALSPDGMVMDSGWALEALNNAPATNPYTYNYPDTCEPAVLYLIDTAIDNSSGYFDGNPNLAFGTSQLVRSIGDPLYSSKFDHGTAMLSMIAGPTHGVAQGTPITVHSYDIYPDGATARLSALVEAVGLANNDKALNHPYDPAVYCIASSATDPGVVTPTLEPAIDYTIGPNVFASVVVSAGNTPGLAKDYTPSFLGSKAGVICAGAIDPGNNQVAGTRGGTAVDVWAPGKDVTSIETTGSPGTTSGTSASTALATGAALIYLSGNPTAIPTALETALVSTYAQSDTIGPIVHVPALDVPGFSDFAHWTSWFALTDTTKGGNDDGDVWTNEEEYIWGFDPRVPEVRPSLLCASLDRLTDTLTYTFPLSCALYQPSALTTHLLRDGSVLAVERSADLETWTGITDSLTLVEDGHADGQVTVRFDYAITGPRCFFRVCVRPSSP